MKFLIFILASLLTFNNAERGTHKIKLDEDKPAELVSEDQVMELIKNHRHFFDLTDQPELSTIQTRLANPLPSTLSYNSTVKAVQSQVDVKMMTDFLTKYSSFHDRYYENVNGVNAAAYLHSQVEQAGKGFPGKFTVQFFNHTWAQPSIIARLEGKESPEEIVVLGAHLDSINQKNPKEGLAPGADDDGSGVTSVLGAIQSLAKSKFVPRRTVEFQFYAAEEVGLRGSQAIANEYAKQRKNVVGMLQLDMTGYNFNNRVKVITDFTDPELSQFLRSLIDNYSIYQWFDNKCGYACSDHASYNRAGFRSCRPAEEVINPRLHTVEDTMEFVDFKNVAEFSKIALSFIVELAMPHA